MIAFYANFRISWSKTYKNNSDTTSYHIEVHPQNLRCFFFQPSQSAQTMQTCLEVPIPNQNRHNVLSTLQWRYNGRDIVSNHQPHDCLLNRLFRRRSKKTSKLRVTGLCAWNSPGTGGFPAQMASNAENGSIWWRHHEKTHETIISFTLIAFTAFTYERRLAVPR